MLSARLSALKALHDLSAPPDSACLNAMAEVLLLGRASDLDDMLLSADKLGLFSRGLRTGIEALRWFRAYYAERAAFLGDKDRHMLARMDSDWTEHLLDLLRKETV